MINILYIAGYGRSGSTIVDLALGNHPDICSLGEAGFLVDDIATSDRVCSCGERYKECNFWGTITAALRRVDLDLISKSESPITTLRILTRTLDERVANEYRAYSEVLTNHLKLECDALFFVDSSKTARVRGARPLLLDRSGYANVYVLHLVRNGKSVAESLINKGSNWALEGHEKGYRTNIMRTIVGWISANIWAMVLPLALPKKRYLRIKFEDFQEAPEKVIGEICEWCQLDATPLQRQIETQAAMKAGHMVGGNRVRHNQNIRLEKPASTKAGSSLKLSHRIIFSCTAGPLNRFFGYK